MKPTKAQLLTTPSEVLLEIHRIKKLLRNMVELGNGNNRNNVILAERQTFKTTALVQFIAERRLILPPNVQVGVVFPSHRILEHFVDRYRYSFPDPALPQPLLATLDSVVHGPGCWRGLKVEEIYADEMLKMPWRDVASLQNFIAGVASVEESPIAARMVIW